MLIYSIAIVGLHLTHSTEGQRRAQWVQLHMMVCDFLFQLRLICRREAL